MIGSRALLSTWLAGTAVAASLALPSSSAAHQVANLSGGQLTITGDERNMLNDLITLDYDPNRDEFVIGQDVFGPHPRQCSRDPERSLRIIHCRASLISTIRVQAGTGSDSVIATLRANVPLHASMGAGNDSFEGGPEVDTVRGGPGADQAYGGPGGDRLSGGGASDKLFGQGGADSLFGGAGSDKLFGGPGNDACHPGSGRGKLFSC